jgi:hypothetical protein
MNKSCEKNQQHIKIFYMWMFCITLKERNTKRFVQNWHSPSQKGNIIVILSCFRYSFNFLHRQNRFYWKTIVGTQPESLYLESRRCRYRSIICVCFYLYVSVVNLIDYSDIDKMMDSNSDRSSLTTVYTVQQKVRTTWLVSIISFQIALLFSLPVHTYLPVKQVIDRFLFMCIWQGV